MDIPDYYSTWVHIKDKHVRHHWRCDNSECKRCDLSIEISPPFYPANGIPKCAHCDSELVYVLTEVRIDDIICR